MASKRPAAGQTVDAFLAALDHPYKAEIMQLRQLILAADPRIGEAIKWNAPSFYTTEYFATFHLRAKAGAQLILHLGAKVRATATTELATADPAGLLTWLAKDRATFTMPSIAAIDAQQVALTALIQRWIGYLA